MTIRSPDDEDIISRIFVLERGAQYTDRASDKGGPTKYGITQATLAAWRKSPVTADDVAQLTEEEAREITYQVFIAAPGFVQITDPKLKFALIDFTYLFGADDSVPALQRIVGVAPDGRLGPVTAKAANAADQTHVVNQLSVARITLHAARVVDDLKQRNWFVGTQAENLRGWLNRAIALVS